MYSGLVFTLLYSSCYLSTLTITPQFRQFFRLFYIIITYLAQEILVKIQNKKTNSQLFVWAQLCLHIAVDKQQLEALSKKKGDKIWDKYVRAQSVCTQPYYY